MALNFALSKTFVAQPAPKPQPTSSGASVVATLRAGK
jgi:hypothetical protein